MNLKVLTMNIWLNGTSVPHGVDKIVHQIEKSGAEIVFLQEADVAGENLAKRLKMNYVKNPNDRGTGPVLLTRYPFIRSEKLGNSVGGLVEVNGHKIGVFSVHLDAWPEDKFPYGPYLACFDGKSDAEVMAVETRSRGQEMKNDVEKILHDFPEAEDFIFGGDFNVPSHLDWVEKTKAQHCGHVVAYPATKELQDHGFTDAYRLLHPDPKADPGNTWSPRNATNADHGGKPEPQDRLDMIHFKGKLKPLTTEVVLDKLEQWPSDHRAVKAEFQFLN